MQAKNAGLPAARYTRDPPREGAPFADACFATVDPCALRPYLTEEEWKAVQVITDAAAFEQRVLLPDWQRRLNDARKRVSRTRLTQQQVNELQQRGYLRQPTDADGRVPIPCAIFAVNKTDGTLRMIWNGIPLNDICHPPPPTNIRPLHEQLQRLLHPAVKYFVAFDFRTWFCQLIVALAVQCWFATVVGEGEVWLVNGVPMGWAWACAVAHALTLGFTRALLVELGLEDGDVVAEHCIDNTIFAVKTDRIAADAIVAALRTVAARFGIRVKESSVETGATVDWLCYRLDADTHTARFKDPYVEKLKRSAAVVAHASGRQWRLVDVWAIAGLAIFSVYAARQPLTVLRETVAWLGAHAPAADDRAAWATVVTQPPPWAEMRRALRALGAGVWHPPPQPSKNLLAWGISDAAWSPRERRMNALVFFTPLTTTLVVFSCASTDIAARELCAGNAMLALLPPPQSPGRVVLYGDNTVACTALRRGWALWAPETSAATLEPAHREREAAGVQLEVIQVPSASCFPDAWTRPFPGLLEGVWTWPRSCAHSFSAGNVCECIQQSLRATGAPMERLERWVAERG